MAGNARVPRVTAWVGFAALGLLACGRFESDGQAPVAGGSANGGAGNPGWTGPGTPRPVGGWAGQAPTAELPPYWHGDALFTRAQRLTNSQFEHAVVDILSLPAGTELQGGLISPEEGLRAFTNNEELLGMDEATTLAFELAVEKAAVLATNSAAALERLYAGTDAPGFIRYLGRRAFRRPLSEEEVTRYSSVFARGEELYGPGFANGASLVIRALLQSPSFMYRTELGVAEEPLTGYEVAAKLSFWILDTTPSDALLDAAAAGELDDVKGLVAAASGMLEQEGAAAMMRDFHRQLYRLRRFDQPPSPELLHWDPKVAAEAKEASLRFFDGLFQRGLGVRDIYTSTRGFVGPSLAPLYSQPAPREMEERELGQKRVGYFMQVPPLMRALPDGEPDPIHRGHALLVEATCADIGVPSITLPPIPPLRTSQTNRERIADFTGHCGAVCHDGLINPAGFAFEGFDATGRARETDHGLPIDSSGTFPFTTGRSSFADARELSLQLAEDDRVYTCYARRLASFGLQRDMMPEDAALINDLSGAARAGSLKDLALALVAHPAFRLRHEDKQ
jgi:hypothetical protein